MTPSGSPRFHPGLPQAVSQKCCQHHLALLLIYGISEKTEFSDSKFSENALKPTLFQQPQRIRPMASSLPHQRRIGIWREGSFFRVHRFLLISQMRQLNRNNDKANNVTM